LHNSKLNKLEKEKGRNWESEKNKKENLMKLKEIKQVERTRYSSVKRDPDNILYSVKHLRTFRLLVISSQSTA
jgi:hypothetical protein